MVNGQIGALLAQLTEFGWQLPEVDRWIAPGGESSVTLDTRSPIPPFVKWAGEQARKVLWDRAAKHYHGRGLIGGPDQTSYKLLK